MIERPASDASSNSSLHLILLPVWLLAIYAIGLLMSEAAEICLWIVCAFFLFALLDPVCEFLKAHRWPTALSAIFLVINAMILTFAALYILGHLFSGVLVELEQSKKIFMHSIELLNATWNSWSAQFPGFHSSNANSNQTVSKVEVVQSSPLGGEMGGTILHGVGSAVTVFTFALLVPILTFFFLAERDAFARVLGHAYVKKGKGTATWKGIVSSTRAFFVGNLVLAIITYPVFILIFFLFGVPSVFTEAALATVFNLVPFAGAILSGFLPAVALYGQNQTLGAPLGLYGCCVGIHFIVADLVTPKILGSKVNINATTSTIALVAWGKLWGSIGLILAIPITSLIKILFEHSSYFWLQWIAGLMSEDVDLSLKIPILSKRLGREPKAK